MLQLPEGIGTFFSTHLWLELCIRILLASACGVAIGYERSKRFKEAGVRTLCIVACVSALLMILSKYGFADMMDANGNRLFGTGNLDPARIAAQIVCGIGFLGAGVIFKNGNSVRGLTTAACIWASASVGMAIGGGMYYLGFFTAFVIVGAQYVLHKFTTRLDGYTTRSITVEVEEGTDVLDTLLQHFREQKIIILSSSATRNKHGTLTIRLNTRMTGEDRVEDVVQMMRDYPEIISICM